MADGQRVCAHCKDCLPVSEFDQHVRANRGSKTYYNSYCRACKKGRIRSEDTRRYSLKKRYGITPEDFDRMLAEQGGCKSCGSATTNGKYWHIDHDHACCPSSNKTCGQCIRGILCHGCNTALGNLDDDPRKVAALLRYAEAYVG